MEWVDGVRLTNRTALLDLGLDPSRLVDTLVQCTMRQILQNGFFHADPHGGNLLVTAEGQLTYIDFGMMSYVAKNQRYAIIEAVVHMVNRDFVALAELYKVLGFIPPDEDIEPIASALNDALPDVLNSSVAEFNFKSVIDKLGDVMYTYPFSLPPFYIAVIRCLGVLEGVALQVDQDFAIIKDAYPFVASRLLTDRSPPLQRALQQLIFKDGEVRWENLEGLLENAVQTSDYDVVETAEQLAEYLLSEEGEPLRLALGDRLVDELDALGADSAAFVYASVISLGRQVLQVSASRAPGVTDPMPQDAANETAGQNVAPEYALLESALATLSVTLAAIGSGKWEAAADSVEALTNEQMSSSMRRALRWVSLLQEASIAGSDLTRVGALLGTLLSERKVQQQLIDASLQILERGILRGIRTVFGLETRDPRSH